jgi:hypothetical protein
MSEPFILFSILQNCVFYCMINFVVTLPVAGGSRICVTAREYYCYKLQMRPDEMNILFYGGRLGSSSSFSCTCMLRWSP